MIVQTMEEISDLPPELIDKNEDEAPTTIRPPLETNSRPQRTRNAPDCRNLPAISDHPLLQSVFQITARKALRVNKEESEPAIMLKLSTVLKECGFHGVHMDSLTTEQSSVITLIYERDP